MPTAYNDRGAPCGRVRPETIMRDWTNALRIAPSVYSSSMRVTDVNATLVMGPLVSGERITSRKGPKYSSGSTSDQSAHIDLVF